MHAYLDREKQHSLTHSFFTLTKNMSDPSQTHTRFINPWVLHLQKLGLELKCPSCLEFYKKPMLLPCNHIFCRCCVPKSGIFGADCYLCKLPFIDQDLREAPYIENVVNIYKNLDASFSTQMLNSDFGRGSVQSPIPPYTSFLDQSPRGLIDSSSPGSTSGNNSYSMRGNEAVQVPHNSSVMTSKLEKCSSFGNPSSRPRSVQGNSQSKVTSVPQARAPQQGQHEAVDVDMNQVELSPDSPPSSGASKGAEIDSRGPGSSDDAAAKCQSKKPVKRALDGSRAQGTDEHHALYCKRQKQLHHDLPQLAHGQSPMMVTNLQNSGSAASDTVKFRSTSGNVLADESDSARMINFMCAFCQTWKITEGSGPMQHFANGKQVFGTEAGRTNVIHVHQSCIDWAPQIYYKDDTTLTNLDKEITRAGKLKCTSCGLKGAPLGCFAKACRRSYHVPCAYEIAECRWDTDDFLMYCPVHSSLKFPNEKHKKKLPAKKSTSAQIYDEESILCQSNFWAASPTGAKSWVLCGSALSADEKFMMVKFANLCGATVTKAWSPDVTHVIAAIDATGACSRTLKVLMATLTGRWILKTNWIKACMESKCPVDEDPYEISLDNHGCCDGPKTGRLRALSNAPMLFSGLNFFFNGDFVSAYKRDLQDLIIAAGGTILENREQLQRSSDEQSNPSVALVVYNDDGVMGTGEVFSNVLQQVEAEMVAVEGGCQAIPHTWLLDSIASGVIQPFVKL